MIREAGLDHMESKKMKEREPRIKVRFAVIGEEYSKEYLSEKLNLEPSCFRTKDDWPEAIKNWPVYNPDILDEYKPKTVWEISTEYEESNAVEFQLKKILQKLKGKETIINQLSKELKLRTYFEVSIKIRGSFPEVALYKESIEFLAKIDADIGFGFY